MKSKICFLIKTKNYNSENDEKNLSNLKKVLPNLTFIDLYIDDSETTVGFLQSINMIGSIEEYKKLNFSTDEIKFFLSHKKIWSTILNNNIPDAMIIDISSAPINPTKEIDISVVLEGLPDYYGYVNLYDVNSKNTLHNKCNTKFNYIKYTTNNILKSYYITNDFCKLTSKYIKKLCNLPKYLIDISLTFKNCYSIKEPLFTKYITTNNNKNIVPSLPVKKMNIYKNDRFYIIKDCELTHVKNIAEYKHLYKNSYTVSSLKDGLHEIIKSNNNGFIVNSNTPPLFNIFDNLPEYVPENMQYLAWIKKNDKKKIIFNNELEYIRYDMPKLNTFYITPNAAILVLMILTKKTPEDINTILSRERVAFAYSVEY